MKRWMVNGEVGAAINPFDRGVTYGDGLFETVAIRNGECRFFGAHYARLVLSCRRLQLPVPERDTLIASATQLVGDDVSGTLKIMITRGVGERGYRLPDRPAPTCIIGFTPEPVPQSPLAGIRVRMCTTRVAVNPVLAGIKTLNRLEQVMARAEWSDPGIQEGIMMNGRDELICGTMTNLFVVAQGALWTPVLNESGVHGVMRAQLMNLADQLGVECHEQRLAQSVLQEADDVLLTNSRIGIWPVADIDGHGYTRNPLTIELRRMLSAAGVTECA